MQKLWAMGLIVFSLGLTGCQLTENELKASDPSQTSEQGALPLGEFAIPEDFPTEIPVRAGEVVVGTSTGEVGSRTWVVEVLVDDLNLARDQELNNLANAGFALVEESGIGTDTYTATLVGEQYTIALKVYLEPETGEKEILYLVTTN